MGEARGVVDLPTTILFGAVPEEPKGVEVTFFRDGELTAWAPVRVVRDWKTRSKEEEDGYAGTSLDPRLGKEPGGHHRSARCALCENTWRRCSGHFGVRPDAWLLNPATAMLLVRVLGAISPVPSAFRREGESGLLLAFAPSFESRDAAIETVRALPEDKRLAALKAHAKLQLRGKGEERRSTGVRWVADFRKGVATVSVDGGEEKVFSPKAVYELFSLLTRDDLSLMGVNSVLGLVFRDLPVLPTPARPTALRDGCTVPHPYSHSYNRICTALRRVEENAPAQRAPRSRVTQKEDYHAQASRNLSELLWPLALGKKKKSATPLNFEVVPRAIGDALQGKEGDIRGGVLGKRAFDTMRSNVIPDCSLKHGQVGVPACLARMIEVTDPCNAWSRATTLAGHRNSRFMNELHQVIVREHAPENTADGLNALRPLRDGDIVALNRQPTLSNTSIFGAEVVIVPGKAIRTHPNKGPTFHMDYDGDEMNCIVPGSYETMSEMRMLMTFAEGHISDAVAQPCVAMHQDGVLGTHLLTAPGVYLTRQEVLRLTASCGKTRIPQSTAEQFGLWQGKDVLDVAFEHLGPDFYFKGDTAEVSGGRLVRGPLKKKHVGNASGGLMHCVSRMCGGEAAMRLLDILSALAHEYLLMRPPCMTAADIRLGEGTPVHAVDQKTLKLFSKAGSTAEACEISEAMVERAHSARVSEPMGKGVRNTFTLLVAEVGCKGSTANLCQQYGAVGQQTVVGRPPQKNCTGRTLPIFGPKTAKTPEAMGFVPEALADGLPVAGNFFHTWSARSGLVDGRLNTPKSGYQQRSLIAPMKNCVTAHDGSVRSDGRIVQFCYGGDGSWPRKTVPCDVPRAELDAALKEALEEGDEELQAAVAALRAIPLTHLSLPVPIVWIMGKLQSKPSDPRLRQREREAVNEAALQLRPYEPSRTMRAVMLVKLRRSERERYGLTGERLTKALAKIVSEWNASRVPGGMPAGPFVGTSIGPPATQSSLDAFHVAGMHKTGASSASSSAAFRTLLNASKRPEGVGMVIHLVDPSEASAQALADALPKKTVASLMPRGRPLVIATRHARAQALLRARAVSYGSAPSPETCVVVPLSAKRVPDTLLFSLTLRDVLGLEVFAWPLRKGSFVVVACRSAKSAAGLLRSFPSRLLSGVPNISEAYPVRALDGSWTVETQGSNLAVVLAMREVDGSRTFSRCTRDTGEVLGVEAAVVCAYREIKRLIGMSNVNYRHLSLFADFMMRSGRPLPFTRHGMKAAGAGPLQRALFECPTEYLAEAALHGTKDDLSSLTAQILVGNKVKVGTGYSQVGIDI